nr:MAG TPA: hypothetical protein [Caudoviricetes sp.]
MACSCFRPFLNHFFFKKQSISVSVSIELVD